MTQDHLILAIVTVGIGLLFGLVAARHSMIWRKPKTMEIFNPQGKRIWPSETLTQDLKDWIKETGTEDRIELFNTNGDRIYPERQE